VFQQRVLHSTHATAASQWICRASARDVGKAKSYQSARLQLKIVKKLKSSLWGRARTFFIFDKGPELPHLFVWGFGRSGTTWVQQNLSLPYNLRPIFEPWHNEKTRGLYLDHDLFLNPTSAHKELRKRADFVFSGHARHKWIDANCPLGTQKGRVIKEVRGAFFLAWLKKQYPSVPFLFLVRNPFNVTPSRKKILFEEGQNLEKINHLLGGFLNAHDALETPLAREILIWAVSNIVPLASLPPNSFDILFYEDLLEDSFAKFVALGKKYSLGTPNEEIIHNLIATGTPTDFLKRRGNRVFSEDLTAQEKKEGMRVLDFFSLTKLYEESNAGLKANKACLSVYEGIGLDELRHQLNLFKGLL